MSKEVRIIYKLFLFGNRSYQFIKQECIFELAYRASFTKVRRFLFESSTTIAYASVS
jgi:hypothetical protein